MVTQRKMNENTFFTVVFDLEMLAEAMKELERIKGRGEEDAANTDDDDMFRFFNQYMDDKGRTERDQNFDRMTARRRPMVELPGMEVLKLVEASESVIMALLQFWRIAKVWNSEGVLVLDLWTILSTSSSLSSVGYAAATFRCQLATRRDINTGTSLAMASLSVLSAVEMTLRLGSMATWLGGDFWLIGLLGAVGGIYLAQALCVMRFLMRVVLEDTPITKAGEAWNKVGTCMMLFYFFGGVAYAICAAILCVFSSLFFSMIPIGECTLAVLFALEDAPERAKYLVTVLPAIYSHVSNLLLPVVLALASRLVPGTSFSPGIVGCGAVLLFLYVQCERVLHGHTFLSRVPLLKYTYEILPPRVVASPQQNKAMTTMEEYISGVRLRRLWRWMCAVFSIVFLGGAVFALGELLTLERDLPLSIADNIALSLTSCDLAFIAGRPEEAESWFPWFPFAENSLSAPRLPFVRTRMGRHDGSRLYKKNNRMTAARGASSAIRCELALYFDPAVRLPSITVDITTRGTRGDQECTSNATNATNHTTADTNQTCSVYDDIGRFTKFEDNVRITSRADSLKIRSLQIAGDLALVDLPGLITNNADVFLVAGQVTFDELLFNDTANLRVSFGDVLASCRMDQLKINPTSHALARCFTAAHVETANETFSNTSEVTAWLCSRNDNCEFSDARSIPVLAADVPNGALGVSLLGHNESRDRFSTWSEMPSKIAMLPDVRSPTLLSGASEWVQEELGTDSAVWVELMGPGQDIGRWLYSTNRAYRYIPVWLVDALSLGVVGPRSIQLYARALPTTCPMLPWKLSDVQTLGAVATVLRSDLGVASASDQGVLLLRPYGEDDAVEFLRSTLHDVFVSKRRSITHSPLITAVVVVGFVAAFVCICVVANMLFFVVLFMIEGGWCESYTASAVGLT